MAKNKNSASNSGMNANMKSSNASNASNSSNAKNASNTKNAKNKAGQKASDCGNKASQGTESGIL